MHVFRWVTCLDTVTKILSRVAPNLNFNQRSQPAVARWLATASKCPPTIGKLRPAPIPPKQLELQNGLANYSCESVYMTNSSTVTPRLPTYSAINDSYKSAFRLSKFNKKKENTHLSSGHILVTSTSCLSHRTFSTDYKMALHVCHV